MLGQVNFCHLLPQQVAFELILERGDIADDGGVLFRSVRYSTFLVNRKESIKIKLITMQ